MTIPPLQGGYSVGSLRICRHKVNSPSRPIPLGSLNVSRTRVNTGVKITQGNYSIGKIGVRCYFLGSPTATKDIPPTPPSNPLASFFGEGASQNANFLTIIKSSLPGLVPTTNNSAESLKVALDRQFMIGQSTTDVIDVAFGHIEFIAGKQIIWTVTNYRNVAFTSDFVDGKPTGMMNPNDFENTE